MNALTRAEISALLQQLLEALQDRDCHVAAAHVQLASDLFHEGTSEMDTTFDL